jgi:hypothetical protein
MLGARSIHLLDTVPCSLDSGGRRAILSGPIPASNGMGTDISTQSGATLD